jgi:CDP-diacylglycerol--glycerol-3-phosphate 3-phosphatidyltransferase
MVFFAAALHFSQFNRLIHDTQEPTMTTPNKITIARILMIPVFVMLAVYYGASVQSGHPEEWLRAAAITIFVLAAASDGLDGYIARRYNQKSELGVILDPIADKGLLLTAIITLSFSNWHYEFPLWFPIIIIGRDVVVVTGALLLHYFLGKVTVNPSWVGKTATVFQMAAIAGAMLQLDYSATLFGHPIIFLNILVILAGLFTFLSGIGYIADGIRQLQAGGQANA